MPARSSPISTAPTSSSSGTATASAPTRPSSRSAAKASRWLAFHRRIEGALDLEDVVLVQPVHLEDGARGIGPARPQLLLHLVDQWTEPEHVGDVNDDENRVEQGSTFRLRDQLLVAESLSVSGIHARR